VRDLAHQDGRRGQRSLREFRKHLFQWFAEFGFDRGPNCVGRIGQCGGLQVGQFPGHFEADDVRPRAEHLAELDKSGAELREGQPHALLDFEVGNRLAVNASNSILDPGEVEFVDPISQAVLRQDTDDFACPVDITLQSC